MHSSYPFEGKEFLGVRASCACCECSMITSWHVLPYLLRQRLSACITAVDVSCSQQCRQARAARAVVSAQAAQKYDYDLVIIGAGVGGHGAAMHAIESVGISPVAHCPCDTASSCKA